MKPTRRILSAAKQKMEETITKE